MVSLSFPLSSIHISWSIYDAHKLNAFLRFSGYSEWWQNPCHLFSNTNVWRSVVSIMMILEAAWKLWGCNHTCNTCFVTLYETKKYDFCVTNRFSSRSASNAENVSISLRHHGINIHYQAFVICSGLAKEFQLGSNYYFPQWNEWIWKCSLTKSMKLILIKTYKYIFMNIKDILWIFFCMSQWLLCYDIHSDFMSTQPILLFNVSISIKFVWEICIK